MKEVTMKLYTFSELSEEVQKSIVERERFNVWARLWNVIVRIGKVA